MDQRVLERALTFAPSIYMASTHTVLVSVRVKHVAICLQNCHTRSGGLWCCYDDEKVGKWKIELFPSSLLLGLHWCCSPQPLLPHQSNLVLPLVVGISSHSFNSSSICPCPKLASRAHVLCLAYIRKPPASLMVSIRGTHAFCSLYF